MQDTILNITVSAFKDYNATDPQPVNLLHWLTSSKYAAKVAAIRAETDKAKRDNIKATLPAITPSGLFTYRSERCLTTHSRFIQVDIDPKENSHITNYSDLKAEICKIMNIAYCGLSVSGTGFWGLIPIAYPDKHRQHFDFIYNAFKNLGITIDKKPRNVAALRGYSYDADAYFNHDAKPLEQYHQPQQKPLKATSYSNSSNATQSQVETLINEITKKGIDIAPNYNEWLNIGFAFAAEFGEGGRQYFHDVSRNYAAYDNNETDEQFNKCIGSNGSGITIKTFFHVCKDAGIVLPKAEKETEVKTARFKVNKIVPIQSNKPVAAFHKSLLSICSEDILSAPITTFLGNEFNQSAIVTAITATGIIEILFTKDGELLQPENEQLVTSISNFFDKPFQAATLDGERCYINSNIVKNN